MLLLSRCCAAGRTQETWGKYFFFVLIKQIETHETQRKWTREWTKTQGDLRTYKHIERNQGELKQVLGIINQLNKNRKITK